MPRSAVQQAIALLSERLWRELLKAEGFRRRAPHLFRAADTMFHIVHFRASVWGSADEGRFAVDIAVGHPEFYELWLDRPFGGNPATRLFPIQRRLSLPPQVPQDGLLEVTRTTDLDRIAEDLSRWLTDAVLPFFARLSDEAAVLDELRAGTRDLGLWGLQDPLHGFLAGRSGSLEEAKAAFTRALEAGGVPEFLDKIHKAADRVGVQLD